MGFDLEREALIASGVTDWQEIALYQDKIAEIIRSFPGKGLADDPLDKARALFRWLWQTKPRRYKRRGSYRLPEVIEAQLDERRSSVGNCLGLTILYNCLLGRLGIPAGAVYLELAFKVAPHVLTILDTPSGSMDIENIRPHGFDYRGHIDAPDRTLWSDAELVADIYTSRGNEAFAQGDYRQALADYEAALALNPAYETARLNRAIALDVL
jgi:tetratricopeptide (TPR) repeat protein